MKVRKVAVMIVVVMLLSIIVCFQLVACDTSDEKFNEIVSCAKTLETKYKNCTNFSITGNCGYKEYDGNDANGTYVSIPFKMTSLRDGYVYEDVAFFCNGEYIGYKSSFNQVNPSPRLYRAMNIYLCKDFDKTYSASELNEAL